MGLTNALADGEIGANYAPDGLDEAAIDRLIAEVFADVDEAPARPSRRGATGASAAGVVAR